MKKKKKTWVQSVACFEPLGFPEQSGSLDKEHRQPSAFQGHSGQKDGKGRQSGLRETAI